jgi:CRP/FNR family transcriptional regulator
MIGHEDYLFLMEHIPFLNDLTASEVLLWARCVVLAHYEKGTQIQSGNIGKTGMILLKSGILRIFLLSQGGQEITLYRLRTGEIGVLSNENALRFDTANLQIEVEADCEILLIDAVSFALLCETNKNAQIYFGRLLSDRLFASTQALERALFTNLKQRLAFFLTEEFNGTDSKLLMLTHDQIARHIGCTREVVTRMLDIFAEAGFVKLARGNIRILDKAGLNSLIA